MKCLYKNDISALEKLTKDLQQFGAEHQLEANFVHCLNLCLDEVITNIISYAYSDSEEHEISLELSKHPKHVLAIVTDDGKAFDPLVEVPSPNLDAPLETRDVGGLGVFFLKEMMDELSYERCGRFNELTLLKKINANVL